MADKRHRQYLAVPFAERQAAHAAGARWDAVAKAWYVGAGADRALVRQWLPGEQPDPIDPRDEFCEAMTAHGLIVGGDHPIGDGKAHRVAVEGDQRDARGRYPRPSGRYQLHLDGHPAGYVKNYRKGTYASWKSSGFYLPPEQMAALRAEVAQREQERAEQRRQEIEAAAARVRVRIATLVPALKPTGYMIAKGIAPTRGALTDRGGVSTFLPAIDAAGVVWTMQTIRRDGLKLFEPDSRKEGTFHVVGGGNDPLAALEPLTALLVAEGYATAAIVADAALQPVVAAFDAGNLLPVVLALRARFPDHPILICGDDDRGVELREGYNPGREKATAAAAAVDGLAIVPVFAPGEQESDYRRFTDFHDLATASVLGPTGVAAQVTAGICAVIDRGAGDAA